MTAALHTAPDPAAEPAPERRQAGALVELLVEGAEPFRVRITNRERIAYEQACAKHKDWPSFATGQNFAMTYCTWSAARRAALTVLTFDQWKDALEDYDVITEEPADPTR